MLGRHARGSAIGATWLALALGPVAVGHAAVADPSGQSVGQAAGGQTVTQPGQCIAPAKSGSGVIPGVGACPAEPPAVPVAPVPPTPPPPPPPAGHPQVKGDRCAGLLSALGSATSALRRLEASKHSAPSYAKKLKKAKQRLTAATKAAAHC